MVRKETGLVKTGRKSTVKGESKRNGKDDITYSRESVTNDTITIVDTNVFLSTGEEIFNTFKDRNFVIPLSVFRELEKYRTDKGGRGKMARNVIRRLESLREDNLDMDMSTDDVPLGNGSTVRVEVDHTSQNCLNLEIRDDHYADRTIMAVAKNLAWLEIHDYTDRARYWNDMSQSEKEVYQPYADYIDDKYEPNGRHVELITNDSSMRFIANVSEHIDAKSYDDGSHENFTGCVDLDLDELGYDGDIADIDDEQILEYFNRQFKRPPYRSLVHLIQATGSVDENGEPVLMENWFMKSGERFEEFDAKVWPSAGPIHPRNIEQAVACTYLNDDKIQMVSFGGVAGAGKSLLALSYGLDQVKKGKYSKITVFRMTYAMGRQDQGYLPGDIEDKMAPWAQAVWDNVQKYDKEASGKPSRGSKNGKNVKQGTTVEESNRVKIKEKYGDLVTVEPITYLRGRTLANQLIIVDDAQSLDRSDILDVISRLGEGSKIIFTFDLDQQDNPYLVKATDIASLISRLKSEDTFGHISFTHSERSYLAQLASRLLNELK